MPIDISFTPLSEIDINNDMVGTFSYVIINHFEGSLLYVYIKHINI